MKKFICTVCGYVHVGENPPAICPICKQPAEKFKEVEENTEKGKVENNKPLQS